ncbi:hypothetical protein O97_00079 [Bartonella henselae str. Zeus]|nr:hypothetical protein O97_00079 [Bartonella henselae str. Zeus]KEC60438.1 hypothetical protein O95_00384 [Bartonella henselae JK 53]
MKGDGKNERFFAFKVLYLPKLSCLPVSKIMQTDRGNSLILIWYIQSSHVAVCNKFLASHFTTVLPFSNNNIMMFQYKCMKA